MILPPPMTIPQDDNQLEMEEVQGLLLFNVDDNDNYPSRNQRFISKSTKKRNNRSRIMGWLLIMILAMIAFLFLKSGDKEVETVEHIVNSGDVEEKTTIITGLFDEGEGVMVQEEEESVQNDKKEEEGFDGEVGNADDDRGEQNGNNDGYEGIDQYEAGVNEDSQEVSDGNENWQEDNNEHDDDDNEEDVGNEKGEEDSGDEKENVDNNENDVDNLGNQKYGDGNEIGSDDNNDETNIGDIGDQKGIDVEEVEHDKTDDNKADESSDISQPDEIDDDSSMEPNANDYESWGHWQFYDGFEEIRPEGDYCGEYRNRDIPEEDFPQDAWQTDAVYVNHFLNEASNLVNRVQEAIYTEYGHGKPLPPEQLVARSKMFHLDMLNLTSDERPRKMQDGAGWTTKQSFEGLVRRLLHAMMTNDTFTVVLGGHSAAAGHGNHFLQSYAMQFHRLMEPIFSRLGMKLITRNLAQGGLGTLQSALGSQSIYGDEIDLLLWDSSMTEKYNPAMDLFARQALIGGKRAPILWGGLFSVLKLLHLETGADVGFFGNGMTGIPITFDEERVSTLPWATRYLKCDPQRIDLCNDPANRFRTKCWIDRDDVIPPVPQSDHIGSQVKWHPGFRNHMLTSRVLAFTILEALEDAIQIWSEVTITAGHPLPDEYWHVSEYYDAIRDKTMALVVDPERKMCEAYKARLPERICRTPLKGRTEFTPRANPDTNSLREILQPALNGYVPELEDQMLYDGPDMPNPALRLPEDAIDVHAIAAARRLDTNHRNNDRHHSHTDRRSLREILPGTGWSVDTLPGRCDGTSEAHCGRLPTSDCLLSGHMDHRGGIVGDGLSGWLVMKLEGLTEGIVIIKLETYLEAGANQRTEGWTVGRNETRFLRRSGSSVRSDRNKRDGHVKSHNDLSTVPNAVPNDPLIESSEETPYRRLAAEDMCEHFSFDYAIDQNVTTLDRFEFFNQTNTVAHAVELLTVLNDEQMSRQKRERDVQVAIRLRGCERENTFKLTHVYWA